VEGNICYLITITDNVSQEGLSPVIVANREPIIKPVVYLTARVHPGESNAQYMVQGSIDFLLSQSKEA